VVQGTPTTTGVLLTGLPTGLAYDPVTGLITGIPTATSDTNVLASCTNSSGSGTTSLLIDATPAGSGLGDGGPYRLTVGLAARWQVGSGITAITGLPAGLTFADGRITGTPTTAGISHLTCAAGSAQTTVAVLVEAVTGLALADPGVISGTVGTALTAQLAASTGSPTWWTASTLPAGLMFDGATGRISGTPTTAGDTTVAISAGDGAVTVRTSLLISIAPRPDTPQPPLSGVAGGGGCGAGPLGAMLLVLLAGAPWCWRRRSGSRPPIP
jgi:hypothetical protein